MSRLCTIGLAVSSLLWLGTGIAQANNLLASWAFDETGVTTGSAIADGTGNGHNGTVVGTAGVPTSVAGVFGTALSFPGGATVPGTNGYVSVPYDAGFSGLNQITLSCWINCPVIPTALINPREAMFSMDTQLQGTNTWANVYSFGWTGYKDRLSAVIGTTPEYDGANTITANAWHLVTMAFNGGNSSNAQWFAYVYVDGVELVGGGNVPAPGAYGPWYLPTAAAGQPLILGADQHQFGGKMDDLGLWNIALTGGVPTTPGTSLGELAALYKTPTSGFTALSQYGVSAMNQLFNLYRAGSGQATVTTTNGSLTWEYMASGLPGVSGSAGQLTDGSGRYYVNLALDSSGGGVITVVPEPSTLVLLASSLVGLVAYAWRRHE
jgi:hypothetical protein